MPLTAFIDDFQNLNQWSNAAMVADGGRIHAAAAGVYGSLTRPHMPPGGENQFEMRLAFDITINFNDEPGRFIVAGQCAAPNGDGTVVGYERGYGIIVGQLSGGALLGGAGPGLYKVCPVNEFNLADGQSYHVEAFFRWGGVRSPLHRIIVQVYDAQGAFAGGASGPPQGVAPQTWYTGRHVIACGTSDRSTLSRFAFEPGYWQSPVTQGFMNATCAGEREAGVIGQGHATRIAGLYIPGGPLTKLNGRNVVFLNLRGSGVAFPSQGLNSALDRWDRVPAGPAPFHTLSNAFLARGIPVIFPMGFSYDHYVATPILAPNYFADDDGTTEVLDWIAYANSIFPDCQIVLAGYSMGGLTVARLIADGQIPQNNTILAAGFFRGLVALHQTGWDATTAFAIQQRRAWYSESLALLGAGHATMLSLSPDNQPNPAFSAADAHALWDGHDAIWTVQQPATRPRWTRIARPIYIDHSQADLSIDFELQGEPFVAALRQAGLPVIERLTLEAHTADISWNSANAFADLILPRTRKHLPAVSGRRLSALPSQQPNAGGRLGPFPIRGNPVSVTTLWPASAAAARPAWLAGPVEAPLAQTWP